MSTASYDAWKKQIEAQTGKTVEELCNRTMEQIDVKPLLCRLQPDRIYGWYCS